MPRKKKPVNTAAVGTVQHDSLPRPVTDEEWADYSAAFPGLTRANVYVTSPGCYDGYNCIGWTVGDTTLEFDVEAVTGMVQFYLDMGFVEVPAGHDAADVDLMAISNGHFASHATKKYTGPKIDGMPDDLWESKLYPGARVTHGRLELAGETYGALVKSFRKA
ncbi:DUF7689 domain-containing protein [Pseudomonas solani]|uniref:DUF7689 domain-containing protein n=1 Tax=Pseudomonas solani TaxID=2731552 RepID=UPI003D6A787E